MINQRNAVLRSALNGQAAPPLDVNLRGKVHGGFASWICWAVMIAVIAAGTLARAGNDAFATDIVYLSGQGPKTAVKWDFFCTQGRNSGFWTNIAVPSQWELQGFGDYDYGHAKTEHAERGLYWRSFRAPEDWKSVVCGWCSMAS